MNSSGKITRSAPCPAAVARARRTFSALPATSPTVGLSCASAMARRSAGGVHEKDVASAGAAPQCGQIEPQPFGNRQQPGEARDGERDADRCGGHVLDTADVRVLRRRDVIGKLLDRGVEQFDDQQQQDHADQRETLPGERRDEEGERNAHRERDQLLAERGFRARGGFEPGPGIERGAPHAKHGRSPSAKRARECRARPLP